MARIFGPITHGRQRRLSTRPLRRWASLFAVMVLLVAAFSLPMVAGACTMAPVGTR